MGFVAFRHSLIQVTQHWRLALVRAISNVCTNCIELITMTTGWLLLLLLLIVSSQSVDSQSTCCDGEVLSDLQSDVQQLQLQLQLQLKTLANRKLHAY